MHAQGQGEVHVAGKSCQVRREWDRIEGIALLAIAKAKHQVKHSESGAIVSKIMQQQVRRYGMGLRVSVGCD